MLDDAVWRETERWVRYALEDIEAAELLEDEKPRHCCLFSQQAAEKAIKSIFVCLTEKPRPRYAA